MASSVDARKARSASPGGTTLIHPLQRTYNYFPAAIKIMIAIIQVETLSGWPLGVVCLATLAVIVLLLWPSKS